MALDFKPVSQRKWSKGLQATFGLFAEPEGILKRLSNMLYDRRGALRVTDGSLIFTKRAGALQPSDGPILDVVLYSPAGALRYYLGLQKSFTGGGLAAPTLALYAEPPSYLAYTITTITRASGVTTVITSTAFVEGLNPGQQFPTGNITISGTTNFNRNVDLSSVTVLPANAGFSYTDPGADTTESAGSVSQGTILAPGIYQIIATSSDGVGGESVGSAPVSITIALPNTLISADVTLPPLAAGFNLYIVGQGRINPSPSLPFFPIGPYSNAIVMGVVNAPGATPPTTGTTSSTIFWRFDTPSYTVVLATLPATAILALPPPPGGGTGSGAESIGGNPLATSQGGVIGALGPTPQIVPFVNSEILALGNGYPPQYYTDGGSLLPVPNTFTAIYPDWEAATVYNVGDNIVDSVSGGVFNCTQSGTSGATRPTFNNTLNAGTADNTVVWVCTATNYQGQALRGAASAIVYGAALWLANTNPTTTSDQQDGPNCIKMSDLSNFRSWNPVNVAMVAKDDGDEITTLGQFTIAEAGIEPTGNLIVFKNFSTYQVTGVFGAADFSIQQAKTDMGCIASRSLQFLAGFGALARMTHLGFAMFDGVNDKVFSEEIRPYLFGDPNQPDIAGVDWSYIYFSKAAQASNPPMYLCACPILTAVLGGITVTAGTGGSAYNIYVKVTKLVDIGNGEYVEQAITNEYQVGSGANSIKVGTPAAQTGVKYRAYAGTVSQGENAYIEAASFNPATAIPISSMTGGTPSVGSGALTRLFCYDLVQKSWAIVDIPFPISALKQIRTGGTQPLTICGDWSDAAIRRLFAGDTTWDGTGIGWSLTAGEIYQQGGSGKVFYRKLIVRGSSLVPIDVVVSANIQGKAGTPVSAAYKQLGPLQWDARVDIMQDGENANASVSGVGPTTIDSMDWYVKPKPAGAPVSAQK